MSARLSASDTEQRIAAAALVKRLRRAHAMGCSDPADPNRKTLYGEAADAIEDLLGYVTEERAAVLEQAADALNTTDSATETALQGVDYPIAVLRERANRERGGR